MAAVTIRFEPFVLDLETRLLTRAGAAIAISPKAFDLLTLLLQERPKVVSKDILQQHLWPATFVAEANLSNLVAEIRGALGDNARSPRFIRTAHGFGYAFCGKATTLSGRQAAASDRPCCWIEWDARRFPLHAGEHFIGRDPDVGVRLDASTVSRRHARLLVAAEKTTLEDLGSKNGTFRGSEPVTAPVALADGDVIGIGSLKITFHTFAGSLSTDTQVRTVS
jgi:DNA-binding winged helix-turn-helix (wHTH) protein